MIGAFVPWSDDPNATGYVVEENGCHTWIGAVTTNGYPRVRWNGRMTAVHLLIWEQEFGPVPDDAELRNRCGNRMCVNPRHKRLRVFKNPLSACACGCGTMCRARYAKGHHPPPQNPCHCGCGELTKGQFKRGHRMRLGDQATKNGTPKRVEVPDWFHELSEEAVIEAAAVAFIEGPRTDQPSCDKILEDVLAKGDIKRWMEFSRRAKERAEEILDERTKVGQREAA